jgi:diguanylate cyclase (GGDEF)-like protein
MVSTGAPKTQRSTSRSQRSTHHSGPTHQPASVAIAQIVQTALRPDVEIDELAELARLDPAFALRVIAFVNSPLIGLSKKIEDVRQACVLLGIRGLRNLALGLLVAGFDVTKSPGSNLLLANCLRRALLARDLGRAWGDVDADILFTTGLFLDVGLLVAAQDTPELAFEMGASPAPWRVTCERAAGLIPHPDRGAQIAGQFGVPEGIVDALIHHHDVEPPLNRASATAWLAERCSSVFEGGDPDNHRRAIREATKKIGFDDGKIDGILAGVPRGVTELAKVFDRDVGPQLDIGELSERVRDELANLNNRYEALVRSLEAIITEKQRLEEELRAANTRLERLASTDELTGLLNRRALEEALRRDLARADRDCKTFSILLLDIDHFKSVNDKWGHQGGDAVLSMVGRLLLQSLRASDAAGRYGGEEFMCLLPATDTAGARIVAERIRIALLQQSVPSGNSFIQVSTSIGIATVTGPGCRGTFDDIVRQADECLYRAKADGRNRVVG